MFKWGQFFYSFLSLIVAIFFLLVGIVGISTLWSLHSRVVLATFLLEKSLIVTFLCLGFFIVGLLMVFYILLNLRPQYYYIKTGEQSVRVEEAVLQGLLHTYWKDLFPKEEIIHEVKLKHNRICITATLPFFAPLEQKNLLNRIEKDLRRLFLKILHEEHPLFLKIGFKE